MKTKCAITGMELTTAAHFSNYFVRSYHPIMLLPTSDLLELLASRDFLSWQEEEAKLLFLALSHSLGMLEVVPPATASPSQSTIHASIEMLVTIAHWQSHRARQLPCLRITVEEANSDMLSFPNILTSFIASRNETIHSEKMAEDAKRLEEAIKVLYSKCAIGANKHKVLRNRVADWAIKVTYEQAKKERVTKDVLELWHKMLTTPSIEAYKFQEVINGVTSNANIEELEDFMTCNLPHGCTASYEVIRHITEMKRATTQLVAFLGVDNFIQVLNADTEATPEPKREDYATRLDYLIALAKHRQTQQRRVEAAMQPATISQQVTEELTASNNSEESEF